MKADRLLRRIVPSIPVLARTPVAPLLDIADSFIRRSHPEWAGLPPASLRMRIGVGNQILRNHRYFIESGDATVAGLAGKGYLHTGSQVLELGCGCGRNALALMKYLDARGTYAGQDVDSEMIGWCRKNLQTGRFRFDHADIYSKVYNPGGKAATDYAFPVRDGTISIIISISVFSHLLAPEFMHYVREGARVLSRGGVLHMTLFLMDHIRPRLGNRWTFAHRMGESYVDSLRYPEAAVAYDVGTVERMLQAAGLSIVEVYNTDLHQQSLIASKGGK
jgi:ubiquinone/menaquinone biosynthesis C-methylase UbiE